ncbi:hypothetical protein BGZ96_003631 [Linnemannia gamsii]|uniref:Uncharacterized protein n=1 Tax=Linnemannia gamsii TaxID=64522 RepID=A0ABQ7KGZ3_9FUNG|nr:hypothetical protein BGZ96_003631 [Linnemannia gamsii]
MSMLDPIITTQLTTPVREGVNEMQGFEPHPKEKEMKVNYETLQHVQGWATLLDGMRDADADADADVNADADASDGKDLRLSLWGWMKIWRALKRSGLAFFLVYRPLMTRLVFADATDRGTLQRYARQCLLTDLLLGFLGLLVVPIAPLLRLFFCSNLRMVDSARVRVLRHGEKCSKAFSESCLSSSAVDVAVDVKASGSGTLKQRRMMMGKRNLQEELKRLVIPSPLPAVPIIPRAVAVRNFVTSSTLSPVPELPEAEATEVTELAPIQIPEQLQQQQPATATGWLYQANSDDEAAVEEYFATVAGSVPLPPLGVQPRRNRSTEAGMYRPHEMTSSAVGYFFTPPEASIENPSDDDEEDDSYQSGSRLPKKSPMGSTPPPPPIILPPLWPIPKCKQHHIPPEYYYPKQRQLSDDYWRLSCPLLTDLEAISGSSTASNWTTIRFGSREGGGGEGIGYNGSISSANSGVGKNRDLKAMALARGCMSMPSALPVMNWRNRDVEYGGLLVASAVYGGGIETEKDSEDEEDEEDEEGLATQEEVLSSGEDSGFGRGGSSESDG